MNHLRLITRARYLNVPLRNLSTNISGGSMGRAWADKEHAAESQYFNKKDAELLQQLAAKLHKHAQVCFSPLLARIPPLRNQFYFCKS